MCIVVSREKTAKDLLNITGIGHPIVAFEIHQIIKEDHEVTSSTANIDLYNVYNTLIAPGFDLTLAAFHNVINDEEPATEADGIAVFKGERLAGFLSPEESKSFLFAMNQVMGGVLTFSAASQGKMITP
jgi:spore germination protein KC